MVFATHIVGFARSFLVALPFVVFAACAAANPSQALDDIELSRIVVKFKDNTGVALVGSELTQTATPSANRNSNGAKVASDLNLVAKLAKDNKLPVKNIFGSVSSAAARNPSVASAQAQAALADLSSYFSMPLDSSWKYSRAIKLLEKLRALDSVEVAYIEPVPEVAAVEPGASSSDTPDFEFRQGYLTEAPVGIDAYHAWTIPGGRGDGVNIADIEFSMDVNHEDLPALFVGVGLDNTSYRDHGTAVMGVVGAVNNGFGVTGIAHNAQIGFVSHSGIGVAEAIRQAADAVGRGGVIIIEVHYSSFVDTTCSCNQGQCGYIPAEFFQGNYDAIRYAVANGVVVIEAAGNGSANLDNPAYISAYDLAGREDSGAIMVGGSEDDLRSPMCWSNHGSYVDVHGWGQNVATTGYGDLYNAGTSPEGFSRNYTGFFSGTSSASPVVAGAAASLQGVALAATGDYLSPAEVEEILVNTGTPQTGALGKAIGPLPNLRSATNHFLGLPPTTVYENVYIRGTAGAWAPLAMEAVYDNVWQRVVSFDGTANPRFKFDIFGDWSENYGDDEADTVADLFGADILVQANTEYLITFHELTRRYSVTPYVAPGVDQIVLDWSSSAYQDPQLSFIGNGIWEVEFEGTQTWERYTINMITDNQIVSYFDSNNDGVLEISTLPEQAFEDTEAGKTYTLTVNERTLEYTLVEQGGGNWQRTLVFIYGETQQGQDMFIRGGIDHAYAASTLGRDCTSSNYECAIPIRHLNFRNTTTAPWKANDTYLDWYGLEAGQSAGEGSPLDWTTNLWGRDWGPIRTYEVDGSGETPLNRWGAHYWLLEVEMDCSATANGWFELKSYISNGPGWENNVQQAGAPWTSGNHFAECGKLNVFRRNQSTPVTIESL